MLGSPYTQLQGLAVFPVVIYHADIFNPTYLSTVELSFDGHATKPWLASVPEIAHSRNEDGASDNTTCSLTILDADGSLLDVVKSTAGRVLTEIFLVTASNGVTANHRLLVSGYTTGDRSFSDDEKSVSLTITSDYGSRKVGYVPSVLLADSEMWPIVYGDVSKLKAVPYAPETRRMTILDDLTAYSTTVRAGSTEISAGAYSFVVSGVQFEGERAEDGVVTITTNNKPLYVNVAIVSNELESPYSFEINGTDSLSGMFLMTVRDGIRLVNFCHRQDGNRCYFERAWQDAAGSSLILSDGFVLEATALQRAAWEPYYTNGRQVSSTNWKIDARTIGSELNSEGYISKYVLCDGHSTEVVSVYTMYQNARTYSQERDKKKSTWTLSSLDGVYLHAVSSKLCVINTADTIGGRPCTTLSFRPSFNIFHEPGADVYASIKSGRTTNVAAIIYSLLDTYTNITPDGDSFTAAEALLAPFPANFAITEQVDAATLCKEIAWQARCQLNILNRRATLIYLSQAVPPLLEHTDDTVLEDGISIMAKDDVETTQVLTAKWHRDCVSESTLKYNLYQDVYPDAKYDEREFFIYAHEELVKMSLYFWGYRMCQPWKRLALIGFLDSYATEIGSRCTLDLTGLITSDGELESSTLSLGELRVSQEFTLAYKDGEIDTAYWLGDPSYPVAEIDLPALPIESEEFASYSPTLYIKFDREEEEETKHKVVFAVIPTVPILRDTNFTVRLEIQDVDDEVLRVSEYIDIRIQQSTDVDDKLISGSDTDGVIRVQTSNGVATISTLQITGGHKLGAKHELLAWVPDKLNTYAYARSPLITVNNKVPFFKWLQVPETVLRTVPFIVRAEGDPDFQWLVDLVSTDADDRVSINSLIIDSTGAYIGEDIAIAGGNLTGSCKLRASLNGQSFESSPFILSSSALTATVVQVTGHHADYVTGFPQIYTVTEYPEGPLGPASDENVGKKGVTLNMSVTPHAFGTFHSAYKIVQQGTTLFYLDDAPLEPVYAIITGFSNYTRPYATFTVSIIDEQGGSVIGTGYTAKICVGKHAAGANFSNLIGHAVSLIANTKQWSCYGDLMALPRAGDDDILMFDATSDCWRPLVAPGVPAILLNDTGLFWYTPGENEPSLLIYSPAHGILWAGMDGIPVVNSLGYWDHILPTSDGVLSSNGADFVLKTLDGGHGITIESRSDSYYIALDESIFPSLEGFVHAADFQTMEIITDVRILDDSVDVRKASISVYGPPQDLGWTQIDEVGPCNV